MRKIVSFALTVLLIAAILGGFRAMRIYKEDMRHLAAVLQEQIDE